MYIMYAKLLIATANQNTKHPALLQFSFPALRNSTKCEHYQQLFEPLPPPPTKDLKSPLDNALSNLYAYGGLKHSTNGLWRPDVVGRPLPSATTQ